MDKQSSGFNLLSDAELDAHIKEVYALMNRLEEEKARRKADAQKEAWKRITDALEDYYDTWGTISFEGRDDDGNLCTLYFDTNTSYSTPGEFDFT